MKIYAPILFVFTLMMNSAYGENEPCKTLELPAELNHQKLVFVIPTYTEFVANVVKTFLTHGKIADESNILDEKEYGKFRDHKIQSIVSTFEREFEIVSEEDFQLRSNHLINDGFSFAVQEKISFHNLENHGKRQPMYYQNFVLMNLSTFNSYNLVNTEDESNTKCIYPSNKRTFQNVVDVL